MRLQIYQKLLLITYLADITPWSTESVIHRSITGNSSEKLLSTQGQEAQAASEGVNQSKRAIASSTASRSASGRTGEFKVHFSQLMWVSFKMPGKWLCWPHPHSEILFWELLTKLQPKEQELTHLYSTHPLHSHSQACAWDARGQK